ncbi:hypothetical protein CBR_g49600 [Chara braunii]|uniref:Uncharacterized protein n=1 Tax=Chara braunii TaxID=69332 RepID=A0A388M585_CHABU|nr:hypothetical protein CBR_g49600 [Chara braunii]|eukprot:GBG89748.1 hypothetical protein CBR_g49600 [Chara braunii]
MEGMAIVTTPRVRGLKSSSTDGSLPRLPVALTWSELQAMDGRRRRRWSQRKLGGSAQAQADGGGGDPGEGTEIQGDDRRRNAQSYDGYGARFARAAVSDKTCMLRESSANATRLGRLTCEVMRARTAARSKAVEEMGGAWLVSCNLVASAILSLVGDGQRRDVEGVSDADEDD